MQSENWNSIGGLCDYYRLPPSELPAQPTDISSNISPFVSISEPSAVHSDVTGPRASATPASSTMVDSISVTSYSGLKTASRVKPTSSITSLISASASQVSRGKVNCSSSDSGPSNQPETYPTPSNYFTVGPMAPLKRPRLSTVGFSSVDVSAEHEPITTQPHTDDRFEYDPQSSSISSHISSHSCLSYQPHNSAEGCDDNSLKILTKHQPYIHLNHHRKEQKGQQIDIHSPSSQSLPASLSTHVLPPESSHFPVTSSSVSQLSSCSISSNPIVSHDAFSLPISLSQSSSFSRSRNNLISISQHRRLQHTEAKYTIHQDFYVDPLVRGAGKLDSTIPDSLPGSESEHESVELEEDEEEVEDIDEVGIQDIGDEKDKVLGSYGNGDEEEDYEYDDDEERGVEIDSHDYDDDEDIETHNNAEVSALDEYLGSADKGIFSIFDGIDSDYGDDDEDDEEDDDVEEEKLETELEGQEDLENEYDDGIDNDDVYVEDYDYGSEESDAHIDFTRQNQTEVFAKQIGHNSIKARKWVSSEGNEFETNEKTSARTGTCDTNLPGLEQQDIFSP
ncbi:unnamed protein product, partial [Protopolystoma xenopodis]